MPDAPSAADLPVVSLSQYIFERCERFADVTLLTDGPSGRAYKGAQIKALAHRFGKSLIERGIKKGDCVALFSPNIPEFVIALLGISCIGAVFSPVNPLYTVSELVKQIEDSSSQLLITIPPFLDKAREAKEKTGIKEIIVFGEGEGATSFASLLANDGVFNPVTIDPKEDLFALPYSSGTTGLAKGVMLTHYNVVSNLHQVDEAANFDSKDVVIGVLPFFHIYGLVVVCLMSLAKGARIISVPKFDAPEFLKLVQEHKVTILPIVPPIVLFLAKHPVVDNFDLTSVRMILSGAAPLGKEMTEAVAARLKVDDIRQGFGMTEASPVTHVSPAGRAKHGSVGVPVPYTEVKVVDVESGKALGAGEDGEICVRGPQVMKGYLNKPDATKVTVDQEGWLHTGDIGHFDEDGHYYVVDRLKELIKYKGFQVPPAELEALLVTHPAVAESAVIGIPDEEAGELPKAFVVKKANAEVTEKELLAFVEERVAPHKKLRGGLVFVPEIPKSSSGKILRRMLRESK